MSHAEVTWPTPEGTSNSLVQLCGQVAVVYVYFMAALAVSRLREPSDAHRPPVL